VFFAIVSDDTLYLRVDDSNREDFTARGMAPFRPYADRPEVSMTYYEVPAEVLEDGAALVSWGQRSLAGAARSAPGKKPRRAPSARS
jgi:DNA transformation protein